MAQLSLFDRLTRERRALSVSELTAQIKVLLEGRFLDVWVEGEVSNFRRHTSGHWYFTLKDEASQVRCACYRMQNRLIRFSPEDGLIVRARGRLSLYEARGEYQLVVEFLQPAGVGALQLAFEQLKKKLATDGLFNSERKRSLPMLPRCIGVVTSPDGAAVRDILRIIKRRNERVSVMIAPARVQGEGAAVEIVEAIEILNSVEEVDVLIVGRGGGSIEDLWTFNEESVARAIYSSRAPVISAVGHETDFTIADFVADLRASTPSAAAEMVATAREEICTRVTGLTERMASGARYRVLEMRRALSRLESSRVFDRVPVTIRRAFQRFGEAVHNLESSTKKLMLVRRAALASLAERLREADVRRALAVRSSRLALLSARIETAMRAGRSRGRKKLSIAAGKLDSLSPLAVLSRGYAIAFDRNRRIIKRATDVTEGDRMHVRVGEGEIDCSVNQIEDGN